MTRALLLSELLPELEGLSADLAVTGLVQDSREVQPGNAFVAIAGFGAHGLNFVDAARAAGASAVLFEPPAPADLPAPGDAIAVTGLRARMGAMADHFHGHPSAEMTTVGVTGTNGKTSTVQLLAQAWTLRGQTVGTLGTLGTGIWPKTVPTGFTTPLVLRLHALLAELRDEGAAAVAMEVSSHALDQGRVDGVHFDVAVFTNLTRDHLDYHGDMASYGAAKRKLFEWPGLRAATVNLDDPFGRELHAAVNGKVRALGFSSRGAAGASVRAEDVLLDGSGIRFMLHAAGQAHPVRSPLLGRFNVDNLLGVATTLFALDMAPAVIAETLSQLLPVDGRMNRLGGEGGLPLVVVDYAHTPDALEQALTSLRAHVEGRLTCVFGCGGERDTGKRPQMAAIAERLADVVIVTDDNPRHENGDAIVADIVAGFDNPALVLVQRDRAQAIAQAITQAGAGDVVLIAGKGHEPYQDVGGIKHPFDDAQMAREQLRRHA
ncbi:MAG TPA: UDP-N-acetylmuramoyl-L-alanyl-D-glutamate--2,6-diaminopimelate ligase [Thermomonas sp.]|jgi:UDP-N-acetylmuramoyl-L-alanyl-D-glutamate--2,6-diaminopimelate ligase|uniref:UDP-N-acetylmuramoyl-L-alanyl-D-glutamate--2, 6-diaminopimelate ligase n=1 Tax=Thermomonas sp. TaxID=1971895 RepID=UPI002CC7E16D|nr:UDP-N-acetylmuramoyl-L-alanyl-D-glutamate--2,6-diaminopimelate ligase [Thermomonas sp.]HOV97067.1 UDP-N-acetylmuramoyl-L-alanyl-D-glutamate--2,6-diaminopimelate ligase [Thermomonas sp.]